MACISVYRNIILQYIQCYSILSWYTVASGMVAVVVKVATVLLSGCNSSCNRLQYTQCCSTELVHSC